MTAAPHFDREHGGDKRFTDSALAGHNGDHLFYIAELVFGRQQTFFIFRRAACTAGRTVMRAGGVVLFFRH